MLPRNVFIQKKSPKGVSIKVALKVWNFTEITLPCECSPVNLMHIFYSNTSGGLLLFILLYVEMPKHHFSITSEMFATLCQTIS